MSTYLKEFSKNWAALVAQSPEDAAKLHEFGLALCEVMTSDSPIGQVEKMRSSENFEAFRALMLVHKDTLGISEGSDRELALWIRTVCYCATMGAERKIA